MDALNFFKFWKNNTTTTTCNITVPHLVVETDTESDEDDSFFDLELTMNDFDNKENNTNKTNHNPQTKTQKTSSITYEKTQLDNVPQKTTFPLSPNEPISKRKVLPIEPISKPQSPISLLRSAPSFRIFTFRKQRRTGSEKTEELRKTECEKNQRKETKVFSVKLNIEDFHSTPTLSRVNSTRNFGIKNQNHETEEPKPERVSKEILQKYLKLIKPLYVKVSKRYSDKVKFSGDGMTVNASPSSSPAVGSVGLRKEKQGSFPTGMKVVSKHLGKSRSSGTVAGVGSPANRSDDTLLQQHDGIQSAILHCKRSFNSRDCSMGVSVDGSMYSTRSSFEDEV
ncbi:unnamed protein product [Trifolium pratense]|uniref:Uncharacterized protein n=1 Tax=Trifolium pratense TaxID=57577 RepID=A0ACB0ICF1_TRIPR|nr:unnamed protein product [Trifolium pratense]